MRQLINRREFRLDKEVYLAKPLEEVTMYWDSLKDFPDESKAKTFKPDDIKNKRLFIRFIWKENQSIAKLYIVKQKKKVVDVDIVYVRSSSMNPIEKSNQSVK